MQKAINSKNPDSDFINSHIHLFTFNHLPRAQIVILKILQPLLWLLEKLPILYSLMEWISSDLIFLRRGARVVSIGRKKKQETIFHVLQSVYPKETKHVVLPLDFAHMGQGKNRNGFSYEKQLEELAELQIKYPDEIFPCVAVDPNRKNAFKLVEDYITNKNFVGIKLYPPFGYFPFPFPYTDPITKQTKGDKHKAMSNEGALENIFNFALNEDGGEAIPVISHCTPGGWIGNKLNYTQHPVTGTKIPFDYQKQNFFLSHPKNYEYLLEQFPKLKICLAHYGGKDDWERHLREPLELEGSSTISKKGDLAIDNAKKENKIFDPVWNPTKERVVENTWVSTITQLIRNHPNVYADISFNAFTPETLAYLKILLLDQKLADRILFGTDFYVVRAQKSEKEISISMRAFLGEKMFNKIAIENPRKFWNI